MNSAAQEPKIRRMKAEDLGRVMEIAAGLEHAPHWPLPAYAVALDPAAVPRRICLVAEDPESDGIAAFAVASQIGSQAELESIAVGRAHQRRGLARRLFSALRAEFEPAGVTEVLLEVRASNLPALQFYRALGFVETGRRPGYYADPVEDALLLGLRLG
jgi:ribosomal-protein-alanine N-acetyltransferase